jgi:lysozyme
MATPERPGSGSPSRINKPRRYSARTSLSSKTRLESLIDVPLTGNQFAALVSLAFNIGAGALRRSTLRQKLNAGDYSGAAREFLRWDKGGGRVLKGLSRRRYAEMTLFLRDDDE